MAVLSNSQLGRKFAAEFASLCTKGMDLAPNPISRPLAAEFARFHCGVDNIVNISYNVILVKYLLTPGRRIDVN
jgi:hypothetical protein